MNGFWRAVVPPGLLASPEVRSALAVGAIVAVASGVVGVFTVLRGQSFAGHALADVGAAGGSGAALAGAAPLGGFLAGALAGAGAMELIGVRRTLGRDLATGVVLGAALGVTSLLLFENTTRGGSGSTVTTILFGSIFAVSDDTVTWVLFLGSLAVVAVLVLFRPLLLSGVHPDLAAAAGVRVRAVGVLFFGVLGVAVALSAIAVGSIMSTALLIGPAATAVRLARRPLAAVVIAAGLGVAATWIGVLLAYDSYTWPPDHDGWPVSFFIVTLIFLQYLFAGLVLRGDRPQSR